jgi:hypothetical protein
VNEPADARAVDALVHPARSPASGEAVTMFGLEVCHRAVVNAPW